MKQIDARGMACPMPVVLTKQQIDAGERLIVTTVDNKTAVQNLTRLGEGLGLCVSAAESDGIFEVTLESGLAQRGGTGTGIAPGAAQAPLGTEPKPKNWVLFVGGEHLGRGDAELGETLMTMFFYTLAQGGNMPDSILFMNGGVKLPTENDGVAEHLSALAARGCEILVCGACLNYYGLTERLRVGTVSNMYEITTRMLEADKVLQL